MAERMNDGGAWRQGSQSGDGDGNGWRPANRVGHLLRGGRKLPRGDEEGAESMSKRAEPAIDTISIEMPKERRRQMRDVSEILATNIQECCKAIGLSFDPNAISDRLMKIGHPISPQTVQRHMERSGNGKIPNKNKVAYQALFGLKYADSILNEHADLEVGTRNNHSTEPRSTEAATMAQGIIRAATLTKSDAHQLLDSLYESRHGSLICFMLLEFKQTR